MTSRVILVITVVAFLVAGSTSWAQGAGSPAKEKPGSAAKAPAGSPSKEQIGDPVKEIVISGSLDSKPKTNPAYKPALVRIGINSVDMFVLHGPAAGFSLAEREVVVYKRLVEILSNGPVNPEAVCVSRVRSAPTIYVGPYRLVSVYARDARGAGLCRQE